MHLHFDLISGLAGDMTVAALIDLGVPLEVIEEALEALPVSGYRLTTHIEDVGMAISARRFEVHLEGEQEGDQAHEHSHAADSHEPAPEAAHDHDHEHSHGHEHTHEHSHSHGHEHSHGHDHDHGHSHEGHHSWAEIREMLQTAPLKPEVRKIALGVFARIAKAEARCHNMPVEDVGFHEVGAVDSIVDIVAAAVALDHLGVTRVTASPVPLGRGFTWSQHGRIPVPSPATLMLLQGAPVVSSGLDKELVTPTGAGILATVVDEYCEFPAMTPVRIGLGGGSRRLSDRPNMVRAILGHSATAATHGMERDEVLLLEANLDDISAEIGAHVAERAMEAGALDVWWTPIVMKKGRPALQISVLCAPDQESALAALLLRESTSLGLRVRPVGRLKAQRSFHEVETPWGKVTVKVGSLGEEVINVAPEFSSASEIAAQNGVPLKKVYQAALAAALDPENDGPH